MFCPETIVFNRRWLMIIRHEKTDYIGRRASLGEVLNPLRYEIVFRPGTSRHWSINEDGRWHLALSSFWWRLRARAK